MSVWVLPCKFLLLYSYYHNAEKKFNFQKSIRVSVCIADGNTKINEDPEWNFGATSIVSNGQYGCNTKYGCFRSSHHNAIVWYSIRQTERSVKPKEEGKVFPFLFLKLRIQTYIKAIFRFLQHLNATNIKCIVLPGRLKGQNLKGEDLYRSSHIKDTPPDNFEWKIILSYLIVIFHCFFICDYWIVF